ncbi:hypothetical protein CDAR_38641 [Caerostris darwini]|uniref:Uncharacterized protein n=1 Tax=Caerostris darwini TaxID=1538125 RepID=A0AAV4URB6_9ARAC|nr:hypothetical protein CDAR_38641 [Caerostris darwini]
MLVFQTGWINRRVAPNLGAPVKEIRKSNRRLSGTEKRLAGVIRSAGEWCWRHPCASGTLFIGNIFLKGKRRAV